MPVLTASTPMSDTMASICAVTNAAGSVSMPVTPRVFWAVMAVSAEVPYTSRAAKVLRSAWMPAPPPESLPAMVRAVRMDDDGRPCWRFRQPVESAACRLLRAPRLLVEPPRFSARWPGPAARRRCAPFCCGGAVLAVTALTALAAQVSVPLPFTNVPFTLQPMVVLLGGAALGARFGCASQVLYLLFGLAGLPVFAASPVPAPGRRTTRRADGGVSSQLSPRRVRDRMARGARIRPAVSHVVRRDGWRARRPLHRRAVVVRVGAARARLRSRHVAGRSSRFSPPICSSSPSRPASCPSSGGSSAAPHARRELRATSYERRAFRSVRPELRSGEVGASALP